MNLKVDNLSNLEFPVHTTDIFSQRRVTLNQHAIQDNNKIYTIALQLNTQFQRFIT